MPEVKIDFRKLVAELTKEVLAIESSDAVQADKTRRFNAAGQKFRNALYGDKRKYSGAAGQAKRIALNTYNTYLSRARKVFEEMGLRHHLLDREIERLKKRYQNHELAIEGLEKKSPTETRLAKKQLEELLRGAVDLRRQIYPLDFSKPSAKKTIDLLKKNHPFYSDKLGELLGENAIEESVKLDLILGEAEPLLEDLSKLKINHEIMYALRMESNLRATHTEKKDSALGTKKRNAIAIHYPHYIQRVFNILTNPTVNSSTGVMYGMSPLTFAICAATGRRPIEVLLQGEFTIIDQHRLGFSGQAKKRTENKDHERVIYSLVDTSILIEALRILRSLPQVAELPDSTGAENETRSLNAIISGRVATPLNQYAKQFFGDENRVLKDTRAIYARICHELWFKVDPRWKKSDDDVFFAELLGHDDEATQMHYKSFKVFECSSDFKPTESQRRGRLERLAEFDDQMQNLANGDSAIVLHEKIKKLLEREPEAKITQSLIIKETGAFRPLIQRYMELCADALGIEKQENGRWLQLDEAADAVLIEVDADDDSLAVDHQEKPRVAAHMDGVIWVATVTLGGLELASASSGDRVSAMKEAWAKYEEQL